MIDNDFFELFSNYSTNARIYSTNRRISSTNEYNNLYTICNCLRMNVLQPLTCARIRVGVFSFIE